MISFWPKEKGFYPRTRSGPPVLTWTGGPLVVLVTARAVGVTRRG